MTEPHAIEGQIVLLRGHRVMLDSALAGLYGVAVRVLNQAVRRNIEPFPDDFMIELNPAEVESLRSQPVILKTGRGGHLYQPLTERLHGTQLTRLRDGAQLFRMAEPAPRIAATP